MIVRVGLTPGGPLGLGSGWRGFETRTGRFSEVCFSKLSLFSSVKAIKCAYNFKLTMAKKRGKQSTNARKRNSKMNKLAKESTYKGGIFGDKANANPHTG